MKSESLISNSYNHSEIQLTVIELHRTAVSITKHFLWWYQYTSPHSQVHAATGKRTEYQFVWALTDYAGRDVLRCLLCSYGTV